MVPTASVVIMFVNAVIGIVVPVLLAWWLVRKHHAKWSTILIGAATFFVFALILESIVHQIVLRGPAGATIQGNTLYYALYGGLMAGLFEETGRFLSMKFLMKKEPSSTLPALAYGVGHGGMEVIVVFAVTMISQAVMALMINAGQTDMLTAHVDFDAKAQMDAIFTQLENAAPASFLLGLWERVSAVILHLSLSVLVWVAVRKAGKWLWLYPAAILLHALVDGLTVVLSRSAGTLAIECILLSMAVAIAALAWLVARKAFRQA